MLGNLPPREAMRLLSRETRPVHGPVPATIGGIAVNPGEWRLDGDSFLLRTESGISYSYRKGDGLVIDRPADADPTEEHLWLNGSVYAAIACINGFMPIHASAIAHDGRVIAFTGPAGAGKSTIIAGLGAAGLPMFCGDTLVLDISDPATITCLPGHKRLKLTPDALAMTGAAGEERVAPGIDKRYAKPAGGAVREPLMLGMLVFLEEGPDPAFLPITGAERFTRLADDHYTAELFAQARSFGRSEQFALQARLARAIPMARFIRPRDPARFAQGVALVARVIGEQRTQGTSQ